MAEHSDVRGLRLALASYLLLLAGKLGVHFLTGTLTLLAEALHTLEDTDMKILDRPQVVILGAGFGGLWAARHLTHSPADVLLVDQQNYHTFLPLLYQVASAELEPEDIAYPVRSILRSLPNVEFALAEVKGVDLSARTVQTEGAPISYDYLIVALGSITHYYGATGAAQHSFPLKTLDEGINLRNHILSRFERAVHETDAQRRRQALSFVIVGGGPTGVETAGALCELFHGGLVRDFPAIDFAREVQVVLVEGMASVLPGMPEALQGYAHTRLRRMCVDVRLRSPVDRVTPESVHLKDGTVLYTETVIWTAGVQGNPIGKLMGLPTARNGQVLVLPTLQVPDHPEVYVVGDLAQPGGEGQQRLLMVAQVANQGGAQAAKNIRRQIAGLEPEPFRYRDLGTMVTIGRNAAVAQVGQRSFSGFPAWVLWLAVHLFNLIGFRNRILVMVNWAWDYFFFERGVRLILSGGATRASNAVRRTIRRPSAAA